MTDENQPTETPPTVGYSPGHLQSEPTPTYDTFDIPEGDVEQLNYDESSKAIKQLERDMRNPSHPLNPLRSDRDSQRKEFMEYRLSLYQRKADTDETPNPYDVALEQAAKEKAEKEEIIREAALKDWNRLRELGYDAGEPPETITEAQARLFLMQRLNAEGGQNNLNQLQRMISEDLRKYNEPPELRSLFDSFTNADVDETLRHELAYQILKYLDAKRQEVNPKFNPNRLGG